MEQMQILLAILLLLPFVSALLLALCGITVYVIDPSFQ